MQSCTPEGTEVNSQYSTQDYEQFPLQYANTPKYATKPLELPLPEIGFQYSYHNENALSSSQAKLNTSMQEIDISGSQDDVSASFARYMHAPQYDEMAKYRMTDISTDPHYESDTNYEVTNASANYNAFFSKPLNDDRSLQSKLASDYNMKAYNDQTVDINSLEISLHVKKEVDSLNEKLNREICSTMRCRDPNLSEVISFLDNPNSAIQANAAAYLQHLCYMDDANKQKTRTLGGIPSLIRLLSNDSIEVHKNACGALRNLSYGRQNDENKRAIDNASGIPALVNLLCTTQDAGVKELVTGVLWNMSSCEDVKRSIIDESLPAIVRNIIKPHSGWDPVCSGDVCYSVVFRNASGVLRNISSAGIYARTSLRNSKHLVDCLLYVIKTAIEENNIGSKTVENCVCTLRNISYRCQEVDDPNYDKQSTLITNRNLSSSSSSSKGENLGCFGTSKKRKDFFQPQQDQILNTFMSSSACETNKGYEILWQPEVVQYYLALLQSCSNPETLEAAAGALQNLSACYWQPSVDIRATVRKEKGLPILVELLRMEVDRVVCAVATALRNLAIDQRNKELIGKYAMRDLVQKLPLGNPQQDQSTSDDTISAVLATINEVIKRNPEFSRSLLDAGGIERLLNITKQFQNYTGCVVKFASQVLYTMWQHHELRDVYKKNGWREQDFLFKSSITQNMSLNMSNNANNTLNRPMASQGGTRYEDKTIQRVCRNPKVKNGDMEMRNDSSMMKHKNDDLVINAGNGETYQHETETNNTSNFLTSNKRA